MFKNITFRIAFTVSLSAHLLAMSAGGFFHKNPLKDTPEMIEVTYIIPETPKSKLEEKIIENLPKVYDLRKKELQKTEKPVKKEDISDALKFSDAPKKEEFLNEKDLKNLEEYIQYYELIRERIKNEVTRNHRNLSGEGRVDTLFTLTQKGELKNISIKEGSSTHSSALRKAALKSIGDASPFPAFPATLKKDTLTFNIAIIFQKQ